MLDKHFFECPVCGREITNLLAFCPTCQGIPRAETGGVDSGVAFYEWKVLEAYGYERH